MTNTKEKLVVTDELVWAAFDAYIKKRLATTMPASCCDKAMKAALQAVFDKVNEDHFVDADKMVDFPDTTKMVEKKPTLLEHAIRVEKNLDILTPGDVIDVISEYLEKYYEKEKN